LYFITFYQYVLSLSQESESKKRVERVVEEFRRYVKECVEDDIILESNYPASPPSLSWSVFS
jgi:hypothetical protein